MVRLHSLRRRGGRGQRGHFRGGGGRGGDCAAARLRGGARHDGVRSLDGVAPTAGAQRSVRGSAYRQGDRMPRLLPRLLLSRLPARAPTCRGGPARRAPRARCAPPAGAAAWPRWRCPPAGHRVQKWEGRISWAREPPSSLAAQHGRGLRCGFIRGTSTADRTGRTRRAHPGKQGQQQGTLDAHLVVRQVLLDAKGVGQARPADALRQGGRSTRQRCVGATARAAPACLHAPNTGAGCHCLRLRTSTPGSLGLRVRHGSQPAGLLAPPPPPGAPAGRGPQRCTRQPASPLRRRAAPPRAQPRSARSPAQRLQAHRQYRVGGWTACGGV